MTPSGRLLEDAVRLHGHLGPFLVFGLRMALRARVILGVEPKSCEVETLRRKPYLCALDGIRAIMGGDSVVTLKEGDGLTARFKTAEGREALVRIRESVLKGCSEVPWEMCEEYALNVMRRKDEEIFE